MDQDDQEETHFSAHMYKNTRIGTGSGIPAINQDAIELQTTEGQYEQQSFGNRQHDGRNINKENREKTIHI